MEKSSQANQFADGEQWPVERSGHPAGGDIAKIPGEGETEDQSGRKEPHPVQRLQPHRPSHPLSGGASSERSSPDLRSSSNTPNRTRPEGMLAIGATRTA